MARILHLIDSVSIGRSEKQLLHHARDTRSARYQVVLGCFQDGPEVPEFLSLARHCGIETVSIPGGVRPGLVEDIALYLHQHNIDLICTHGNKANVVGHFAAKFAGVAWVPFVHDSIEESCGIGLYDRLERSLLTRSARVACTSAVAARELARARRGRPAPTLIPNAVLPARRHQVFHTPTRRNRMCDATNSPFVIAVSGKLHRESGHKSLFEALAEMRRVLPERHIELLVLGDGPEEAAFRSLATKLKIEKNVCFAGNQPQPTAWLEVADCLINLSRCGSIPNQVSDAMFCGIPTIAVAAGDVVSAIHHGETGLVIDTCTSAAFVEAMRKMICFPEMRRQLAYSARHHVTHNLSPARQRELLESLYTTMLGAIFTEEREDVVA